MLLLLFFFHFFPPILTIAGAVQPAPCSHLKAALCTQHPFGEPRPIPGHGGLFSMGHGVSLGWVAWWHCSKEDVVVLAKRAAIAPTLGTLPCRVVTDPLLTCTLLGFGSQTPPVLDICSSELCCWGSAPCMKERLVP